MESSQAINWREIFAAYLAEVRRFCIRTESFDPSLYDQMYL